MTSILFQFDDGFYCAGALFDKDSQLCVRCAPILRKWLMGVNFYIIKEECKNRGIKIRRVK